MRERKPTWGTTVVASRDAVTLGVLQRGQRGIVVHADGLQWWVIPEGHRTVKTWYCDFWDVAAPTPEPPK